MKLEVADEAWFDLATAIQFYNSKPGLFGKAFRNEFKIALRRVKAAPRQYSPVEDGPDGYEAREFLISRFDQRVIYLIRNNSITVVAIVHASSRPGIWHSRLGPRDT